jgi:Protein of unknown function (DUF1573)
LVQKYQFKSVLLKNSHNNINISWNETFLYICGLKFEIYKKRYIMKKTILLFALSAAIINVNAQKAAAVDPHAGHNHAKQAVTTAAQAVKTAVNAATPEAVKAAVGATATQQAVMTANKNVNPAATATMVQPAMAQPTMVQPGMVNAMAAPAVPVQAAPVAPLPETLVSKELEFDFGKIPQGKPVTHIFTVTNTSKAPYKLDNVQASCGCTTPEWEREKMIEPGASVDIKVGFNAGAVAPFTKPVTITYNGTQTKVLTIKGEVYSTPATSAPANVEAAEIKK